MTELIYEVKDLTKIFETGFFRTSKIVALNDVTFNVNKGDVLSIVGESGSGKSTLAKILLKLEKPTSGKILYKGIDLSEIDNRRYWREVQAVFQDPYASFNPVHKVDHVLKAPLKNYFNHLSERDIYNRIKETLEFVGLRASETLGKYPHQFSGGQLQRIMIARALLVDPEVLIADEPVSMIDASLRIEILNLLHDINAKRGITILFITHDLSLASYISNKILVLYRGEIMEYGDSEEIIENPLHPYTQLLMSSIPQIDRKFNRKLEIELEKIEEINLVGCVFQPRCPYARDICINTKPKITSVKPNHLVRCHLYGEPGLMVINNDRKS
ncbi:ABC transporter ATP-binding protein [Vulcanisaeta sp. JCM 16161]|uniref:ABC transporter ATP-binding protein n=1 Tax=Vulcanisaeta sp. JCM 16161 TaxID=1295372 RepID=UPI00406C80E7